MGKFKLPQLTTAQRTGLTLDVREIVYDTDLDLLYYGDGVTVGGLSLQGATGPVGPTGPLANVVDDPAPQLGGFLDPNSNYVGSEKGSDLASATPLVIGTDGDYFDVTGTTGFSVMTVDANRLFRLQFDGILTIIHGGSINFPGGVNFTTAVGDEITFFSTAANTVRVVAITKADGTFALPSGTLGNVLTSDGSNWVSQSNGVTLGTPQITTSGSFKLFTGIPPGVKRININFNNVSVNSLDNITVQIGDSGGIESTGYESVGARIRHTVTSSSSQNSHFPIIIDSIGSDIFGNMSLFLENETNNTWVLSSVLYGNSDDVIFSSGRKSLTQIINQLRINTISGSFDLGEINISYI